MGLTKFLQTDKIIFTIVVLVMCSMSLHVQYLPPLMVFWCLCLLISIKKNILNFYKQRKINLILFSLFIIYYFWQILSISYSEDLNLGLSNLFGRLSLIVFPLVLINPPDIIVRNIKFLIRTFAFFTFLFLISCYSFALYRSLHFEAGQLIFNHHLPDFPWLSYFYGTELVIFQHPTYVAMYVLLSVLFCFEAWFDKLLSIKYRAMWLLIGLMLIISEYFISSRAGILISLLLVSAYSLIKFKNIKRKILKRFIIIIVFISLIPLVITNSRVDSLYNSFLKHDDLTKSKEGTRLIIWQAALNIFKQHVFMGVGIGDVQSNLSEQYSEMGKYELASERLNAHNQYLEVLVETGIVGFFIFIAMIITMLYIAVIDKNLLYFSFGIMIVLFFLFETILYRFAGVSFFSLFSFLLMHYKGDEPIAIDGRQD